MIAVAFQGLAGSSLGLTLGLGALLVVGLYWLRLRRRRVAVPYLPLWEQFLGSKKATSLLSQLQRLFSLLLALALFSALVFSLAEPDWSDAEEGRSLIVLIDVGASMGEGAEGKPGLVEAKERATKWIAALGRGDEMLLVEAGARPRPVGGFLTDEGKLKAALGSLESSEVQSDLGAALRFAGQAARGRKAPEIFVLSDSTPSELSEVEERIPLFFDRVGEVEELMPNLGITAFSARRYPHDAARFEVLVELINESDESQPFELSIYRALPDGARGAALEVLKGKLGPGELRAHTIAQLDGATEGLLAELTRSDASRDQKLVDNIARALLSPREAVKILLVGEENQFLEAALLIEPTFSVKRLSPSSYPPKESFDITVFDGVDGVAFPRRVAETGAAVYFGAKSEGGPVNAGEELELFGFDSWKEESPFFFQLDPYSVQILKGSSLEPQSQEDEVLASSEGRPFVLSGTRVQGPFVSIGFSPKDSDFVLRPSWPLFLLNLVDELVPRARGETNVSFRTGEVWRPRVVGEATSALLRGPLVGSGEVSERRVPVFDGRAVFFGQKAGFYELSTSEGRTRFAASYYADSKEREEAKLPAVAPKKPAKMEPRSKHEPWFWLLAVVAGISFLEWWSFHRRWTV